MGEEGFFRKSSLCEGGMAIFYTLENFSYKKWHAQIAQSFQNDIHDYCISVQVCLKQGNKC